MSHQANRPSFKEIDGKLKAAKECLKAGRLYFCDVGKVLPELDQLDISAEDVGALIEQCLEEITANDYAGSRPPQRSYEKAIAGMDLFAFAWDSAVCGKRMYLKFVIKDDNYYYVSFHKEKGVRK